MIRQRWLEGATEREISELIGVSQQAVSYHLNHTIKPLCRNEVAFETSMEMARAEHVIRLAFEGFYRSREPTTKERQRFATIEAIKRQIKAKAPKAKLQKGRGRPKEKAIERTLETITTAGDRGWLELVAQMMRFKAEVKGAYAPKRLHLQAQTDLRVAGSNPSELETKMVNRIAELLAEKRRHQQIIDQAARNAGEG